MTKWSLAQPNGISEYGKVIEKHILNGLLNYTRKPIIPVFVAEVRASNRSNHPHRYAHINGYLHVICNHI